MTNSILILMIFVIRRCCLIGFVLTSHPSIKVSVDIAMSVLALNETVEVVVDGMCGNPMIVSQIG